MELASSYIVTKIASIEKFSVKIFSLLVPTYPKFLGCMLAKTKIFQGWPILIWGNLEIIKSYSNLDFLAHIGELIPDTWCCLSFVVHHALSTIATLNSQFQVLKHVNNVVKHSFSI